MKRFILPLLLTFMSLFASMTQATDKVLMVLTSHSQMGNTTSKTRFWLSELTHPYYILKNAGYEIDIASIEGAMAPIDPRSMDTNDRDNQQFLNDAELMAKVINSQKLANIKASDYQAVVFSGGHGTMWDFPNNPEVNNIAATIYENQGVVAAICHGPAALSDVKLNNGQYLIAGKKFAGFTNEEEAQVQLTEVVPFLLQDKLTERGGIHVYGNAWQPNAVIDQRLITGQNPQSAHKVGQLLVEALNKLKG